ncbi:MAG: TIGR04100 family radical SAM protein [Lachnospiraceae bacterium]|nr:TIGR04100 family radical SAM protein [Lachnospiraceae bacterium]
MELLYKVHNNLYVNLTNRCPYACTFCLRQTRDQMGESGRLWLEREPSAEEVIAEFEKFDMTQYHEVVFCGFGEPMMALDVLLKVAAFVKQTYQKPIRINTNGAGNLIYGRNVVPELKGLVDCVSISLNHPDKEQYEELVRSNYKGQSYDAMLAFARECVGVIPKVVLTTVATTISAEEEERCRAICDEIGAEYRIRPWEG